MCARKPGARCEASIVEKQHILLRKLEQVEQDNRPSPTTDPQKISAVQQEIFANTIDFYATPKQQKFLQRKKETIGLTAEEETYFNVGLERKIWQSSVAKQLETVQKQYVDEAEGIHAAKRTAEFMMNSLDWQLQARIMRKKKLLENHPTLTVSSGHTFEIKQKLDRFSKEIIVTQMNMSDLRSFIMESNKKFGSLVVKA